MAGIHFYYLYNIYNIHENVSASVFTITAIVMSQNMKPSSPAQPPSPAGSQARSMFSGSLFQVGTPHQLSTSMVSYRNFKIFQYTISTQCAYLFTIKLWQNKRSDMQNIGEELGTGTVFMFLYTLLKKWILSIWNVNSPIHHTTTTSSPSVSVIFTDIEVQHSTAGGTPAGVLRTIVLRRVLELGIRKVTTKFREHFHNNRRRHYIPSLWWKCLNTVSSSQV